ncbi:MAG: DNA internalization-related competence protein ComEC/Rec2 [Bacteroidota bacterium]
MSNYPLIKFVIVFAFGIVLQSFLQHSLFTLYLFLASVILITIILHLIKTSDLEVVRNIFSLLSVLLLGLVYYSSFTQLKVTYPLREPKYVNAQIIGTVENIELKREGKIIFYLSVDSLKTKEGAIKRNYNFLCSIYDNKKNITTLFNELQIGNRIQLNAILQKPRDERNPGEFDYEKYLNGRGIAALANSYSADDCKIISAHTFTLRNLVFQIRKKIDRLIVSLHNKTTSGLLRGLILADRGSIDYDIKNEFINAGVVHVLSVSGLHVGYIVLIFVVAFNRFNLLTRYALTIFGLLFYLILTGADAPVFRSTIMALAILAAPASGREYHSFNSLALSAFIILLISPKELFNPSFQLSFSAILSLIVIYPPLKHSLDKIKISSKIIRWLLLFCLTSLAAQIGTLPFTLTYFHKLSFSALIANIIVIPVSGAIVGLGILTLIVGTIFSWIGCVFASANELLTYLLYFFVRLMGSEKFSYISIPQFSVFDAVIFYLILSLIFFILKKFYNLSAKIVGVSFSIITMIFFMRLDNVELMPENNLSVIAVDVGQGDALLVKFPNGKTALIDAGNKTQYFDNGARVILPLIDKLKIDTINYGFISHVDSDHYKGFISLIKNHKIKFIYKPKLDTSNNKDVELEMFLRKQNVDFKYYSKEIIPFGNARIYVLNDTINHYFTPQNSNDKSGMLKLVYGKTSFLFTGDAGVKAEKYFVDRYKIFLKSNVLKAGHHGSITSTSEIFLKTIQPDYAIISAGVANKFHHPSKVIVERLKTNSINTLRTDQNGAILLRSDGDRIKIINWRVLEYRLTFL